MKLVCAPLISALQFVMVIKPNWQSFQGSHVPFLINLQNIITTFHSHRRPKIVNTNKLIASVSRQVLVGVQFSEMAS